MKTTMKNIAVIAGAAAALASGAAMAESTYGYDNAVTPGVVVATAKLKITVKIPKLVLLRVGSAGNTTDELTFTATPNIQTLPGTPLVGTSQGATWDANAPIFAVAPATAFVGAYAWHNASSASLTCSVTTLFTSGLLPTDVTVISAGALTHPGGDTGCAGTTTLARNTVLTATWTYAVSPAAVANAAAGSDSEIVTYTATTL